MRRFTLNGENLSLGTGSILAAIRTAADKQTAGGEIAINRVEISQSGSTTSAQCRAELFKRDTAGTLTVTSATPAPIAPVGGSASGIAGNTALAGGAARCGVNSSADSGGAYVSLRQFNFNNLNGYLWIPTPEERIIVPPAMIFGVRFIAAPGTTTGWTIAVDFEELA